jgi:hypothetical protein
MVGRAGRDRRHLDRDVVSYVPFRTPASGHVVDFIRGGDRTTSARFFAN